MIRSLQREYTGLGTEIGEENVLAVSELLMEGGGRDFEERERERERVNKLQSTMQGLQKARLVLSEIY